MAKKSKRQLQSASAKAADLGICVKTLDRWIKAGIISKPLVINRRRYFVADEQPRTDTASAAA